MPLCDECLVLTGEVCEECGLCPDCCACGERVCRVCGCSDLEPCLGGCSWVQEDLCSACANQGVPE